MRLLKITFLLSTSLAMAQVTKEEKGLNQYRKALHLGIGYFGGVGTEDFTVVNQNLSNTTYTFKNGSWGKGIYLKLGYSYKIHPSLALGIEGGYLMGLDKDLKNHYANNSSSTYQVLSCRANNWRAIPYAQFEVPVNKDAAIYAKLGYVFGFGKMKYTSNERNGNDEAIYKYDRSGGLLHGTNMALGYRFKKGDLTTFFVELNFCQLQQKVEQDLMVKAEVNGHDVLSQIKKYYTNTEYVDELTVSSNSQQPNLDQSRKKLTYQSIHSAVGVVFGVNFYFPE